MKKIAITESIVPGRAVLTYFLQEVRGYLDQCGYYTIATGAASDHLVANFESPEKIAKLIRRDEQILASAFEQCGELEDKIVLIFIGNTSDARIYDRNREPYALLDGDSDPVLKLGNFYDAVFHVYTPKAELEKMADDTAKERCCEYNAAIYQAWHKHPGYYQIVGGTAENCTDSLARKIEDFLTESL